MSGLILVGTSGWSYRHWSGDFYPRDLPAHEWFPFYAARFPTVEINTTFYRLPSQRAVDGWRRQAPPGFRFAVKGSRYITHVKRLKEAEAPVAKFTELVAALGPTLAVMLWQLPPQMMPDVSRLDHFLGLLPPDTRHAIEFRNPAWLRDDVFDVLRRHDVPHVLVSSDTMPMDLTTTGTFVYVRFHGLAAEHGAYSEAALAPWASFLAEHRSSGGDAYVYFNNDVGGHAPRDAARLTAMIRGS